MSANVSNLLYLIAGILFILALRGLSHPTTSRQGNLYGMAGMGLALLTTLVYAPPAGGAARGLGVLGIPVGGGLGARLPPRGPVTAVPPPVPGLYSLPRPSG